MRYKLNTNMIEIPDVQMNNPSDQDILIRLARSGILVPVEDSPTTHKNTNNGKPHICGQIAVHNSGRADALYLCPKCNMPVDATTDKEEWDKKWFEFCKLGGLHCTEEAICMEQEIQKREKEAVKKSRQDWLREEIERLEGMKYSYNDILSCSSDVIERVNKRNYNKAISDIQDHYQKELKQK